MSAPAWAYLVGAVCYALSVAFLVAWIRAAVGPHQPRKATPPADWAVTSTGVGPSNVEVIDLRTRLGLDQEPS